MELITTIVAAILIAVGIAGLVVPVLPGLLLTLVGVGIWAWGHSSLFAWCVFIAAVLLAFIGWVVQYLIPGRQLARAGIPGRTTLVGVLVGAVGFFVIPVVGVFIGFVFGVFLAEDARLRDGATAWASTKTAARAALTSMWIELIAASLIAILWMVSAVSLHLNPVG